MIRRVTAAFAVSPLRMDATSVTQKMNPSAARRVLVLAGPTGVGKSKAALEVARSLNGEIVGADSVQLFRGLNVGSNKASLEEQSLVPHHLLDIANVTEGDFSAGRYLSLARKTTDNVLNRGHLPIVVGGTMMYLRWFVRGRPSTPPPTAEQRAAANSIVVDADGDWDLALSKLAIVDPERAQKLSRNDWYRLRRALEVVETVGSGGMSALPQTGASPLCEEPEASPYDLRCVFLYDSRIELNRRIDQRCESMIAPSNRPTNIDGALNCRSVISETAQLLLDCGVMVAGTSPARAIGYRQTIRYLTKRALGSPEGATQDFRQYVADFMQATRNYAKQQMAWFRKDPQFRWVRADSNVSEVLASLMNLDEDEYRLLSEVSADSQKRVREDIIEQGRAMRTYLVKKRILIENSQAESDAVELVELVAAEMRAKLRADELQKIHDGSA